ncbi:MAG: hypothetical protein AcusKO_45980 [Acuticoccus sp.]
MPDLPETTLLHAGPPFADPTDLPAPMRNSVVAAARFEGFADDEGGTMAALRSGGDCASLRRRTTASSHTTARLRRRADDVRARSYRRGERHAPRLAAQ